MVASGGWEADLLLAAQVTGAVRYHGFHPYHRHACCEIGRNIFCSPKYIFTQSDDGGQEADEGEQEAAGGERGHVELGGGLLCNIGMGIIFCPSLSQSGM